MTMSRLKMAQKVLEILTNEWPQFGFVKGYLATQDFEGKECVCALGCLAYTQDHLSFDDLYGRLGVMTKKEANNYDEHDDTVIANKTATLDDAFYRYTGMHLDVVNDKSESMEEVLWKIKFLIDHPGSLHDSYTLKREYLEAHRCS